MLLLSLGFFAALTAVNDVRAANLLLTNDDGWAVANIRALLEPLSAHDLVLSAPAVDKSGTGSSTTDPVILVGPCEFDTCPDGSPGVGHNNTNSRLNWVNAFPSDAARIGIQNLSVPFFNGEPDLVVSGPNVGSE